MGVRLSGRGRHEPTVRQRRRAAGSICVARAQCPKPRETGGKLEAERLWIIRHARQRLGVVRRRICTLSAGAVASATGGSVRGKAACVAGRRLLLRGAGVALGPSQRVPPANFLRSSRLPRCADMPLRCGAKQRERVRVRLGLERGLGSRLAAESILLLRLLLLLILFLIPNLHPNLNLDRRIGQSRRVIAPNGARSRKSARSGHKRVAVESTGGYPSCATHRLVQNA